MLFRTFYISRLKLYLIFRVKYIIKKNFYLFWTCSFLLTGTKLQKKLTRPWFCNLRHRSEIIGCPGPVGGVRDLPGVVFHTLWGCRSSVASGCMECGPGWIPVHPWLDLDNEFISYVIQFLKLYCFTSALQLENQLISIEIGWKTIYSYQY